LSKSKKDDKILGLQYDLEALNDEVEHLSEVIASKQARIVELIRENDRLTLAYEPYRPPGDEWEGVNFYDLVEENEALTQKVLDKMQIIEELDTELYQLKRSLVELKKAPEIPVAPKRPLIKYDRFWNVSFELWPGSWGLSYYRYQHERHGSQSREGSIYVGPFGFSWNREPKRV